MQTGEMYEPPHASKRQYISSVRIGLQTVGLCLFPVIKLHASALAVAAGAPRSAFAPLGASAPGREHHSFAARGG